MRWLGIDYGDARIGLALSDPSGFLASAIGSVQERRVEKAVKTIAEKALLHNVRGIVVGLPKNMDGTEGMRAKKTREFASFLSKVTGLEVVFWDERLSTVSAHGYMNATNTRGKKRKQSVDALSAQIILQNYLDSLDSGLR
jgi:putative Holliday junction resolvase